MSLCRVAPAAAVVVNSTLADRWHGICNRFYCSQLDRCRGRRRRRRRRKRRKRCPLLPTAEFFLSLVGTCHPLSTSFSFNAASAHYSLAFFLSLYQSMDGPFDFRCVCVCITTPSVISRFEVHMSPRSVSSIWSRNVPTAL